MSVSLHKSGRKSVVVDHTRSLVPTDLVIDRVTGHEWLVLFTDGEQYAIGSAAGFTDAPRHHTVDPGQIRIMRHQNLYLGA